jgi:hypothetical protein
MMGVVFVEQSTPSLPLPQGGGNYVEPVSAQAG